MIGLSPIKSSNTKICPSQLFDAPIPMVGILIFLVTNLDKDVSTHSNTIEKAPADCNNSASFKILFLSAIFLPLNLKVYLFEEVIPNDPLQQYYF